MPARTEPQRRLRPPRRHNAQDFRLPVLGPADLAGNTEEDGIPVVEPFHRDDVALLKRLIAEGKINPVIDRTYLFSELREAISYLETGNAQGKVVTAYPGRVA